MIFGNSNVLSFCVRDVGFFFFRCSLISMYSPSNLRCSPSHPFSLREDDVRLRDQRTFLVAKRSLFGVSPSTSYHLGTNPFEQEWAAQPRCVSSSSIAALALKDSIRRKPSGASVLASRCFCPPSNFRPFFFYLGIQSQSS